MFPDVDGGRYEQIIHVLQENEVRMANSEVCQVLVQGFVEQDLPGRRTE
ncbi:hypothetical protein VULLAG_LOCUS12166 [Vulpes lagopus]